MTSSRRKYISVEVEVDEVLDDMDDAELMSVVQRRGIAALSGGSGTGDAARTNNIIDRAYHAARNLPNLPREIADLFWHVHGRAI